MTRSVRRVGRLVGRSVLKGWGKFHFNAPNGDLK